MTIQYDEHDGIATITLDRPEKLNAMNPEMYDQIGAAFTRIETDPGVRVGIVTGSGDRAFSAGADLKEMHSIQASTDEWKPWSPDRWDFGLSTSKPLIAAINGYALAGGLELALLCDIRIAASSATFGTPEVKWDLLHGYGAYRLPQIMGLSNAMDLLLTGEFIDAPTALRTGLISRVVPDQELMASATAIAQQIRSNGPMALRMTKELVQRGLDTPIETHLRLMKMYYERIDKSADQREGLTAFAEKRNPRYGAQPTASILAEEI